MTSTEQLERQVKSIADDLTNGVTADEEFAEYNEDVEVGDNINAWVYFQASLDMDFTINSDGTYKSATITVAVGGPHIYIDTKTNVVIGRWGSDNIEWGYVDNLGVDGYCEEMFDNLGFAR